MANNPIELLQDRQGKLSRTGVMFLVWMVFFMTLIGVVTFKTDKLADIPEAYTYITLVLCGTYTARRFLDNKPDQSGILTKPTVAVPPADGQGAVIP